MEEGLRSGGPSGLVVKNRNSSGCLIVRKKSGDGVGGGGAGSSSSRKVYERRKEKKRSRLVLSDSGSSDELLPTPRRRVAPETIRVCNGLSAYDKGIGEGSGVVRKRERLDHVRHYEDGMIGRNGFDESERKRNKMDVFEFDEYDGLDGERMRRKRFDGSGIEVGGRRYFGSMDKPRGGMEREYETGPSRHGVDKRKNLYFDRTGGLNLGDNVDNGRFKMSRDGAQLPQSFLREKFGGHSDEPIRVQGKNGVLKVMVNKKKKLGGGPLENFDPRKAEESRKSLKTPDVAKRNIVIHSSSYPPETKLIEKPGLFVRPEKSQLALQKPLSSKNIKGVKWDSEDSDTSLKLRLKNVGAHDSMKKVSCTEENTPMKIVSSKEEKTPPCEKLPSTAIKEGKVRRGSGTEKQKLRERIRGMLLEAGWTIDYRPRRNRDYLDAVYINPSGTAYWSIIKAYDALQKQLKDEDDEAKPSGDVASFAPIADDVLSQLTRKTRKKIEKELKKKRRDYSDSENEAEPAVRRSASTKHDVDSMDSASHEEKLSSFIKQGSKSMKGRMNENGSASVNSKSQNSTHDSIEKASSGSNSRILHGRKSRKLGRCTLLVRSSKKGQNSETDGFIPYTGKRTLLSWLIDSKTVELSQKVQYMNRRRTRVMLEGWITRDGIHCGCCSKILTVSKFEIHAGSKLRQPFQHICLDSGISLLQCQIEAWNSQEESERIGFHSIDIDGDDPNDDTCGICADGGDLICCDGCPSTFHQSCLDIQTLPTGDWHCPNCTCKFCGLVSVGVAEGDDSTASALLKCSLCDKKYHESCMPEMDAIPVDSNNLVPSFCGQKCKEIFEHLQKYLGVKHELEAGFSWSLIHRMDEDSDTSLRGLPQRVEGNSKLAVALTVMDECFLPVVDRRSGVNLIHNVLYNCGSNFNRINYSGFYTAILERGDEIICAASIRFHGTKLAEMPFIGTRHIYRRQGMCRRLFGAIESALCSLKVEKLIIPAIAELMHTWTMVFGFTPLEESLRKEMRSMNMLVFPGTDMLQKLLLEQDNMEGNMTASTGAKQMECKIKLSTKPEAENKSDVDSLAGHDSNGCNSNGSDLAKEIADEVAAADDKSDKDSSVGHDPHACDDAGLHDANEITDEVVATDNKCDMNSSANLHGYGDAGLQGGDELMNEVADADNKSDMDSSAGRDPQGCDNSGLHDANDSVDYKSGMDSASGRDSQGGDDAGLPSANETADNFETADSSSLDALKIPALTEQTVCSESLSGDKLAESVSKKKPEPPPSVSCDAIGMGNKPLLDFPAKDNMHSSVQCPLVPLNDTLVMSSSLDASDEVKIPVSVEGTACSDSHAEGKLAQFASGRKCMSPSDISHDALELDIKPAMDFPVEDYAQSLEVSDMDGVREINDINCLEPVPSSGEIFAENTTKEINEKQDVSDSTQSGSGECSLQFKYDSNIQIVCETEGTLHASDSDDKSETAARERKTESSSV